MTGIAKVCQAALLLDIANVDAIGDCHLFPEGLTNNEKSKEQRRPGDGWQAKSERESSFPLEVIRPVLQLDIRAAKSTKVIDKTRILNSLVRRQGTPLNQKTDTNLPMYENINRRVRGIFAVASWCQAVSKGYDISSEDSDLPLARILMEDTKQDALKLFFCGLQQMRAAAVGVIARSLPAGPSSLDLSFLKCSNLNCVDQLGMFLEPAHGHFEIEVLHVPDSRG